MFWRQKTSILLHAIAQPKPLTVVAISGGVDSAVAAALLKQQGYSLLGLFMRNWDEVEETGRCFGEEDERDARDYAAGRTPNPDIMCNRQIKFGCLCDYVFNTMGADCLATGHYARRQSRTPLTSPLLRSRDALKDQTFFLCGVPAHKFDRVLFPIGELHSKDSVRAMAQQLGFSVAQKRSSRGICFIGPRNLADFLGDYIQLHPGEVVDEYGTVLGTVDSVEALTVGQRIKMAGMQQGLYVARKYVARRRIVAVPLSSPRLFSQEIVCEDVNWFLESNRFANERRLFVRIRHQGEMIPCEIHPAANDTIRVTLERNVYAPAPGQTLCVYDHNDEVILGGVIQ